MTELWRARESQRDNPVFQQAFAEAWRMGRAHEWVLDSGQQSWCAHREESSDFSVWMIARQRGKSFAALFDDLMFGNRTPGAIIRYLGQTGDSALAILGPTMDQIMAICPLPKHERPYPYNKNDTLGSSSEFRWDNTATIVWSGTDNDTFRRQRGPRSHRITFDEAGFYPKLTEVEDALLPSLQTTGGSPLYLSTPPISPGHPFVDRYDAAAALGRAEHETIHDNPRLTPADVDEILRKEAGLKNQTPEVFSSSTYWKREYLAEVVLDTELAVVPEFPGVKDRVVAAGRVAVRPPFYDLYFAGDPGMDDLFGGLFGYLDFRRSRFVIEHELLLAKAATPVFAAAFQDVLIEHYPCPQDDIRSMRMVTKDSAFNVVKPHSAVLDDPSKRICADLWTYHGLSFAPALKDDREAAINAMRVEVGGGKFEIHPRCVHLIAQLGTAVRVKPGGDMQRSKRYGHFDLVSSLWYLNRSIDWARNPYPADYGFDALTQVRREVPPPQSLGQVLLRGTSLGRRR